MALELSRSMRGQFATLKQYQSVNPFWETLNLLFELIVRYPPKPHELSGVVLFSFNDIDGYVT